MGRGLVLVLVLATGLLAGCSSASDDAAWAAGCGECVEEMETVRTELDQLRGVQKILTVTRYRASPTNGAGVKVELRSKGSGDTGAADAVAKIVWQSRVTPLTELFVTVVDADDDVLPEVYDFATTSRAYPQFVEEWGERPVE